MDLTQEVYRQNILTSPSRSVAIGTSQTWENIYFLTNRVSKGLTSLHVLFSLPQSNVESYVYLEDCINKLTKYLWKFFTITSNISQFRYIRHIVSGPWGTGYDINPIISTDVRTNMANTNDLDTKDQLASTETRTEILNHNFHYINHY